MTSSRHRAAQAFTLIALLAPLLLAAPASSKPGARRSIPPSPSASASQSSSAPSPALQPPPGPDALSIGQIDVLVRQSAVLVTTSLLFGKGAWQGDPLEAFIAYGAPAMPTAFEAALLPLQPGEMLPSADISGRKLPTRHAKQRPSHASLWLGPSNAAGQTVTLPTEALTAAFAPSQHAALRLRTVYNVQPSAHGRSLLVRISQPGASPPPLGVVTVRREDRTELRARVTLCSTEGPETELVVSGRNHPRGAIAPPLAPRRADDALCLRIDSEATAQ